MEKIVLSSPENWSNCSISGAKKGGILKGLHFETALLYFL